MCDRDSDLRRAFVKLSGYSADGFADLYDKNRPGSPSVVTEIISTLIGRTPEYVVDLGSGTGLSSFLWQNCAGKIIGIEPNDTVREYAIRKAQKFSIETVEFKDSIASDTKIQTEIADVVTCSQSFHWMEPVKTLTEIARILKSGGIFAAYDYSWPPTIHWELEAAYFDFKKTFEKAVKNRGVNRGIKIWPKENRLKQIRDSGKFRHSNLIYFTSVESGTAEKFKGMVTSRGPVHNQLMEGMTLEESGLADLYRKADRILGIEEHPFYIGYRMWIGVK